MKIAVTNNVVTIKTDIPVPECAKMFPLTDDKGNLQYSLQWKPGAVGVIGDIGACANAEVDGNMAIVVLAQENISLADVRKQFGKQLIKLASAEGAIKASIAAETAALNEIFDGATEA